MRYILILLLAFFATDSYAASVGNLLTPGKAEEVAPAAGEVKDELGRDTPRAMVEGLRHAFAEKNYERAAEYLNLNALPKAQRAQGGAELASKLHMLLDQNGWVKPPNMISDSPEGDLEDEQPEQIEKIGGIRSGQQQFPVLAEKITPKDAKPAYWVISAETLSQLDEVAKNARKSLVNEYLPESLKKHNISGVPIGHWLALLIAAIAAYAIVTLLAAVLSLFCTKVKNKLKVEKNIKIAEAFGKPFKLFLAVVVSVIIMRQLGVSMLARQTFIQIAQVVVWVSFAWLLWRLIDAFADILKMRLLSRGQYSVLSAVVFIRRALKFALLLILGITVLDSFGFNVTTWIAALGIGGIALALGAQKTVENFVGSLTLIADRPIAIGDFCKFGSTKGTVEDIGMRSTRVRTPDRTVVSIPNGEFSTMQIENYTRRDGHAFSPIIGLRYETTPDQIRYITQEIHDMLRKHDKVSNEGVRVNFITFGSSSLDIEIVSTINVRDVAEAQNIKQELNLRIMEIVAEAGSDFAFPSQMAYEASDFPLDAEKAKLAASKIKSKK